MILVCTKRCPLAYLLSWSMSPCFTACICKRETKKKTDWKSVREKVTKSARKQQKERKTESPFREYVAVGTVAMQCWGGFYRHGRMRESWTDKPNYDTTYLWNALTQTQRDDTIAYNINWMFAWMSLQHSQYHPSLCFIVALGHVYHIHYNNLCTTQIVFCWHCLRELVYSCLSPCVCESLSAYRSISFLQTRAIFSPHSPFQRAPGFPGVLQTNVHFNWRCESVCVYVCLSVHVYFGRFQD